MDLFKNRRAIIMTVFLFVLAVFFLKLFQLQILDNSYKDLASQNIVRKITLYPDRGLIYDRQGRLIVANDAIYDLYVIPRQVKNLDTVKFAGLLNMDVEEFKQKLKKSRSYSRHRPSLFVKQIPIEEYAFLQEYMHQFPGFYTEMRTVRRYPYSGAAHILGYIGEVDDRLVEKSDYYKSGDYIGINGLEKTYEALLRGKRGSRYILVDVFNREKGSFQDGALDTAAVSGNALKLSIDIELQVYGETLMKNKKGSLIAIEPETGEILAMISSPAYDPNLLSGRARGQNFTLLTKDTLNPLFNRPIMAEYPPGSTFKPVMALVGLQEKTLRPSDTYTCNQGYTAGSLRVGCRPHPYVNNLSESLQQSCNTYYCHVFRNVIDQRKFKNIQESLAKWNDYMYSFGLGNALGVDLLNEKKGLVPTPKLYNKMYNGTHWKSLTVISLGIGQGEIGTTPLQLANMIAVVANHGFYYTPHFVTAIANDTTNALRDFTEPHRSLVSKEHFPPVVEGLFETVEKGTARGSKIPGIEVCGKTGTAQNPHGEDHSLFVAFAPKDKPKIAIAVVVENAGGGSKFAAPIASLMIEKYISDTISTPRKVLEQKMMELDLINNPPPVE